MVGHAGSDLSGVIAAYSGAWAIAPMQANTLLAMARDMNFEAHREAYAQRMAADRSARASSPNGSNYRVTSDGVALLELRGVMMKSASSLSMSTGTVEFRRDVRAAANDSKVRGIMLVVESPGGTVAGTAELADDVKAAATQKPTWAFAEDLIASAAYWVGSQTSRIGANRTAVVGSLGTIAVLYDFSKAFDREGIKPLVFSTGEFKGAATPGTEITPAQRQQFQTLVDETNTHFRGAVESGRGAAAGKQFDGRVHVANSAAALGLVDVVSSFEDYYGDFVAKLTTGAAPTRQATATASPAAGQTHEDLARAEWRANRNNCHARFRQEKVYVHYRLIELRGSD